jgi:hypothetical protein
MFTAKVLVASTPHAGRLRQPRRDMGERMIRRFLVLLKRPGAEGKQKMRMIIALAIITIATPAGASEPRTMRDAVRYCERNPDARENGVDENLISVHACAVRVLGAGTKARADAKKSCLFKQGQACDGSEQPDPWTGCRAPKWALYVIKRRGGTMAMASPTDPIWQHATCDRRHHNVTWHFPGE